MPVGLADPASRACFVTVLPRMGISQCVQHTGSLPKASFIGSVYFCSLCVCPIWLLDGMQNVFWMPLLDKHGCQVFLAEHTRLLAAKPYMQILLSVVTHLPASSCGINSRMNKLHMPELNIILPIWSFVKKTSLNSGVKA